jgi:hypothetical protein
MGSSLINPGSRPRCSKPTKGPNSSRPRSLILPVRAALRVAWAPACSATANAADREHADAQERPAVDTARPLRRETEGPFLDHISGIRDLTVAEQHIAAVEGAALGADRQNAQRLSAQKSERRDALEKGDVVLDAHS